MNGPAAGATSAETVSPAQPGAASAETVSPAQPGEDQRSRFYRLLPELLATDRRLVLVLTEIGAGYLDPAATAPVADRVLNVGIREQLMIGLAGGLALASMRPIVHTFAPFLLERPFEQVKLDLGHQGAGAVLVSAGASYGWPEGGETHFGRRDVALLDTLDGWEVHVPGHPDEVEALLRRAAAGEGRAYLRLDQASNRSAHLAGAVAGAARSGASGAPPSMVPVRTGRAGTVVAVGPMLDRVLEATSGFDVAVLYATTVRPFDAATLRATLGRPEVVVVEPYLAWTSAGVVAAAPANLPHRLLCLGVGRDELRRYGTVAEHDRAHGLDAAIGAFFGL